MKMLEVNYSFLFSDIDQSMNGLGHMQRGYEGLESFFVGEKIFFKNFQCF